MKGIRFKTKRFLKKESPIILATIGALGVVATVVSAIKASPKAEEVRKELPEEATVVEKVKAYAPVYGETCIFAGVTIACITSGAIISHKQQAQLIAGYIALERSFHKYRERLADVIGLEDFKQIEDEINSIEADERAVEQEHPGMCENELRFYDLNSKRFFTDTLLHVHDAQYALNQLFSDQECITLNDWYRALDHEEMPPINDGDMKGWSIWNGSIRERHPWLTFDEEFKVDRYGQEYIEISTPQIPSTDALL